MAYIVMAYRVMACIVMVYIVLNFRLAGCTSIACLYPCLHAGNELGPELLSGRRGWCLKLYSAPRLELAFRVYSPGVTYVGISLGCVCRLCLGHKYIGHDGYGP